MSFTYTNNVPNPPNLPSTDVRAMQENTQSIDGWVEVDHIGFNLVNGGNHRQVHMNKQPAPPRNGLDAVFYTDTIPSGTGPTSFPCWNNSLGSFAITGSAAATNPSNTVNGVSFLPGSLLIQWGTETFAANVHDVTFSVMFPATCYNVQITLNNHTGLTGPNSVITAQILSKSQFRFSILNNTGTFYDQFFWIAIGI